MIKDMQSTKVLMPIHFPLKDGTEYELGIEKIKQYQELYDDIDVIKELHKCKMWDIDNPSRRKTKRGIMRHINMWLSNAKPTKTKQQVTDDWRKEYE
ncbi:hypothetical protein LIP36_10255 [Amedibacillus dolichus]|uniref:hypothetical protein n=1 Tax=Amedibacillus dolichus TaxID=31971 RepID=UPI001D00E133|nr:hypothetical protein [Amedibacillus dolichus]MCB5373980.1 hypothetical protein [Amedibacillus dolichus]